MAKFTNQDIIDYYDHTERHMRMFWKLDDSMGLHYGIWGKDTKTLGQAIENTNRVLLEMGEIRKGDKVLDAGCGVGGSSIYIAKKTGATCTGITLSKRQTITAAKYAAQHGVSHLVNFEVDDYTNTKYADNTFDVIWALETICIARDKSLFFKEAYRILKPGGKLMIADWYKSYEYDIKDHKCMQDFLYGFAMEDLLTVAAQRKMMEDCKFRILKYHDATPDIKKTVNMMYWICFPAMIGTKLYVLFHPNATRFSKTHYKTGFGQYHGYRKKLWEVGLFILEKPEVS